MADRLTLYRSLELIPVGSSRFLGRPLLPS